MLSDNISRRAGGFFRTADTLGAEDTVAINGAFSSDVADADCAYDGDVDLVVTDTGGNSVSVSRARAGCSRRAWFTA